MCHMYGPTPGRYAASRLLTALALWGLLAASALAADWQPVIADTALPQRVVAVDKGRQLFHLYEKKSPLALKYTFDCTTGQVVGDKKITNDMRTPEGVYFVEYKIAKGLDFKEYGGIAYTLNYPNPVDRLRGKTGYGIWIHSKGQGIVPRDTRGCIAIGLKEIDEVGPLLTPGTAVLVGENVPTERMPARDDGTVRHLRMRMDQWTRAWASRSGKLFDFYDADAYSKAMPENFSAFKVNKERLFKRFAWINIFNREVFVLEGPGYWVTWAEQFYRAPNLSTEGVRRLYWQRGADKQFRIVGMEWTPRNVGLQAAYEKGQLVASAEVPGGAPILPANRSEAPTPPPLSMPESAEQVALAPAPAPVPFSDVAPPAVPPAAKPTVPPVPVFPAEKAAQAPVVSAPAAVESASAPAPQARQAAIVLDDALMGELRRKVQAWGHAWQNRSSDFFNFYDQKRYGTLKDIPFRDTFRNLKADMTRRFRAPWIDVLQRPARMEVQNGYVVTLCEQLVRVPGQPAVEGLRSLYWQRQEDHVWRIVASHWESREVGMQADYLEEVTASVTSSIEAWRKAWEKGDVPAYSTYYADNARQQGKGKAAIVEHKTRIWARIAPEIVQLAGVRVQLDPQGVRVDMTQVYRDSSGRGDKGTKTLLMQPGPAHWLIMQEDWSPLPTGQSVGVLTGVNRP